MSVKMKFHYVPEEEIENICFYKPGGYHPVKLGDIFQRGNCPAYRVLHKLGWGSFATVWLARDMLKRRYVALKILTAEATTQGNEVQLLVWLGKQSRDHPGYKHIPHVLDHFQVTGPNGMHDILVMEPMVSLSWVKYEDGNLIRSHAKTFIRQTMSGVSYLHMLGVMHGDLHLGNLALTVPTLDQYSEAELLFALELPECTVVLPLDPTDQTDSLPPYVVMPITLGPLISEAPGVLKTNKTIAKIIDFGNAFCLSDKRPLPHTPPYIRAPEIEIWERSKGKMAADWGIPADIWSLGCTIYELLWPNIFFYNWGNRDVLMLEMAKSGGAFPSDWLAYVRDQDVNTISCPAPDADWEERRIRLLNRYPDGISTSLWNENTHLVVDMLRKMIRTDPQSRYPIKKLLCHPWFDIGGLKT